jgi:hypothetical protein
MPGGGGGNRQDNRQRGNAAQLLEKYKSLARDAQLGGDRVQTEYYLQYADHYFRVLSESRSRFEDQRPRRDEDSEGDEADDGELIEAEAEAESGERPQRRQQGRGRDDRQNRDDRYERQGRPQRGNGRARDDAEDGSSPNEPGFPHDEGEADERIAFDVLPPAIGADDAVAAPEASADEEEPRPRRRARRPRADDGEADIAPAA